MALKKDTLTKAQKAELEQLRPFIVRQGLQPIMTGANWRSALDAVIAVEGFSGKYRYRGVRDQSDPGPNDWIGPLPEGLPLYNFIEWLEVSTEVPGKGSVSNAIKQALDATKINFTETAGGIRIYGYKRHKT